MKTALAIAFLIFLTACSPSAVERTDEIPPAVLEGHLSFGPFSPVARIDEPTPEIPPEMFEGRFVLVSDTKGQIVYEIPVGADGHYQMELKPDTYIINVTTIGIETAKTLPAEIKLVSGETFTLDIFIDTGLR